jgi:LmbE family N-acetylglucosaminyl deacetylase
VPATSQKTQQRPVTGAEDPPATGRRMARVHGSQQHPATTWLLLFESLRSPTLTTEVFVDISDVIGKKFALVACRESQTSRGRFVKETIRARATLHRIYAGVQFVERFEPVRLA